MFAFCKMFYQIFIWCLCIASLYFAHGFDDRWTRLMACPDKCDCSYKNGVLCAFRSSIPKLPNDTTTLLWMYASLHRLDNPDVFANVSEIKSLFMWFNGLSYLKPGVFGLMQNLTYLDLRFNKLSSIDPGIFDNLPRLTNLSLAYNAFVTFPPDMLSPATQDRLIFFDAQGNVFLCSCHLRWLGKWMIAKPHVFNSTDTDSSYVCLGYDIKTDGAKSRPIADLAYLADQACILEPKTTLALIIIFSLVIGVYTTYVVYRMVRVTWYSSQAYKVAFTRRVQQAFRQRVERLAAAGYQYDVFIVYAEEDSDIVMSQLVPVLENDLHLKLCLHQRDFHPGRNVLDNIHECLERSARFLLIFSSAFAASRWCDLELTLCQRLAMERGQQPVVIVTQNNCQLTAAMDMIVKTQTYIQNQRPEFWPHLFQALNDVIHLAKVRFQPQQGLRGTISRHRLQRNQQLRVVVQAVVEPSADRTERMEDTEVKRPLGGSDPDPDPPQQLPQHDQQAPLQHPGQPGRRPPPSPPSLSSFPQQYQLSHVVLQADPRQQHQHPHVVLQADPRQQHQHPHVWLQADPRQQHQLPHVVLQADPQQQHPHVVLQADPQEQHPHVVLQADPQEQHSHVVLQADPQQQHPHVVLQADPQQQQHCRGLRGRAGQQDQGHYEMVPPQQWLEYQQRMNEIVVEAESYS